MLYYYYHILFANIYNKYHLLFLALWFGFISLKNVNFQKILWFFWYEDLLIALFIFIKERLANIQAIIVSNTSRCSIKALKQVTNKLVLVINLSAWFISLDSGNKELMKMVDELQSKLEAIKAERAAETEQVSLA